MALRPDLLSLLQQPDRVGEIPEDVIPALLGELEALRVRLLARLLAAHQPPRTSDLSQSPPDRLLTTDEAAELLNVTPKWLARHASQLPFTRRLSRKALRFSEVGLRRWLATRSHGHTL